MIMKHKKWFFLQQLKLFFSNFKRMILTVPTPSMWPWPLTCNWEHLWRWLNNLQITIMIFCWQTRHSRLCFFNYLISLLILTWREVIDCFDNYTERYNWVLGHIFFLAGYLFFSSNPWKLPCYVSYRLRKKIHMMISGGLHVLLQREHIFLATLLSFLSFYFSASFRFSGISFVIFWLPA